MNDEPSTCRIICIKNSRGHLNYKLKFLYLYDLENDAVYYKGNSQI